MESIPPDWLKLLGDLGSFGILVWYLWYRTAVSDPKREAKFCETIDGVVGKFDAALKEERAARRDDLEALRESLQCRAAGEGG